MLRSYDRHNFPVTGGEDDGALRVVRLLNNELRVFARRHGSDGWVLENVLQLPEATRGLPGREGKFFPQHEALIVAAESTHVLVTPQEKTWPFSVDLDTSVRGKGTGTRGRRSRTSCRGRRSWWAVLSAVGDQGADVYIYVERGASFVYNSYHMS